METLKMPISPIGENETGVATATNEYRRHNPGLRALLSIRNCNITLEKELEELQEIEGELEAVNKTGMLLITTHCDTEMQARWNAQLSKFNASIASLNKILEDEKDKIGKIENTPIVDIWAPLALNVNGLRESAKKCRSLGSELLPEQVHQNWENEYSDIQESLVERVISHVESCRVLLRMIEKYTPEELNIITKIVVDKIPLDFAYQEAVVYEQDYFKALVDFKQEFAEEKNLWDKFLDILAGGTHQQPSERVMMERWIEGEKGELK